MYEKIYEKIANSLVENGYIVIEDALDKELSTNLLNKLQTCKFQRAGISSNVNKHIDNTKRRDKIKWLDEDNAAQSDFLKFTKGLQDFLNYSLYLGLSYYESHFAIYDEGDFYEKHLDAFKNSKNRVVTTVYYLNKDFTKDDGGELLIYDENNNLLKKVIPQANTLIIFLSEKFPHEVLPAKKRRYSIAGWFRVDK